MGLAANRQWKLGGDQQKMNRSRAAILKQAADAVSGGERTADRSAFQMCESKLLLFSPLALSVPIRSKASGRVGALDPTREWLHSGTDNFASKISASPPMKYGSVCVCVCAPWKLTPSPKWLVVRPPRFSHVVQLLKGAWELLSV